MELKELNKDEFENFIENFNYSSLYQSIEYAEVMSNQKHDAVYVGLIDDNNEVCAASLILIEKLNTFKYAYAPRGFLIDYKNKELLTTFTNEIKKYLKKKNVIAIKISPAIAKSKYDPKLNITLDNPEYENIFNNLKELKYYHLGYNDYFESYTPRFEVITELEGNINDYFNNLSDELKSKINICDLAGIRIYKGNEDNLEYVYEQMRKNKKRNKEYINDLYKYFSTKDTIDVYFAQLETNTFLVNTQKEYQKQINNCNAITDEIFKNQGKPNTDLINKKIIEDNKLSNLKEQLVYATNLLRNNPNGIIMANAIIIKHHNKPYLILDGLDETYKHLCPNQLLLWKIIEKYYQEGYKEFNLGEIANPNLENNKFKELNELKLSFNSYCIEYAGDFELVTNYPLYSLYRNSSPIRKIFNNK